MTEVVPVLLAIIAVVALVGNILVVILFIKNRKWLKKTHNCLILTLAIQDILTAIGLLALPWFVQPPDVYTVPSHPTLQKIYCSLIWSQYFPFCLGVTSVYTCLMLTIERWFAIVKPMTYRRLAESPKLIAVMVITPWLLGFGLEMNGPLSGKVRRSVDNTSYECHWKAVGSSARKMSLAIFTFFGTIFVPSILMALCYVQIIMAIKRSSRVTGGEVPPRQVPGQAIADTRRNETRDVRSLQRITQMVFGASAVMIACWLPDQTYYALSQFGVVQLATTAHAVVKVLAFANSCLNPFVYGLSNRLYRREFKAIFSFCFVKYQQFTGN